MPNATLVEGPALTLRLRAGFGVNAKADLLSVLLGFAGEAADLKVIVVATGYTERAIRTATDEMTLAGFIHEIEGRPSSFYTHPGTWAHVLQTHTRGTEYLRDFEESIRQAVRWTTASLYDAE
ncbi:MAG: hypothetical protein ACREL7_12195 [Longimicrobiales bacterium]